MITRGDNMELYKHVSGLYLRKGTYDTDTVKEIKKQYTWMPVKYKKVLDIGGCFGGYSKYALDNGAKEVWTFEPEPRNYFTICKNLEKYIQSHKSQVFNHAVVLNDPRHKIPLYLSTNGKSFGNFSTTRYRGRTEIEVKTMNLSKIFENFQPEVLKIDCEGQEHDLLQRNLPECVKYFTMEIHLTKPNWIESATQIIKQFDSWECVKKPKFFYKTGKPVLFTTIGAWKR